MILRLEFLFSVVVFHDLPVGLKQSEVVSFSLKSSFNVFLTADNAKIDVLKP